MKSGLIGKGFLVLTLAGFLSQPVAAATNACPGACTGSACAVSCPSACLEKVNVEGKHWWNFDRTGYRVVFKGETVDCCTGCAAPVYSKGQVLVPKRWFWESDEYKHMSY